MKVLLIIFILLLFLAVISYFLFKNIVNNISTEIFSYSISNLGYLNNKPVVDINLNIKVTNNSSMPIKISRFKVEILSGDYVLTQSVINEKIKVEKGINNINLTFKSLAVAEILENALNPNQIHTIKFYFRVFGIKIQSTQNIDFNNIEIQ